MLDKNPEETMTATFSRIFICKSNFLCCMNQNSMNPLILVFSTKEKCELIFDAILKSKSSQAQSINPVINEKELFENIFYLPLIKAIKNGANEFQDLKTIVLDFVVSLENDEKNYFFNALAECSLSSEFKENVEDEKHVENSIQFPSASETVFSIPFFYRCIKCIAQKKVIKIKTETHEDGSKTFDFNTEKHICEPIEYLPRNYQSSLILKSPNFKLVKRESRGQLHPLLIIFASDDRNMCYKFGFDLCHNMFFCYECKKQGRSFTARFIQYEGKTAVEFNRLEHICKTQKYIP
uniref:Uncharacterized protein n=1 Tax=Panagrolaimus sp. PS1159 TaxID=55785 RepID=A0AC35F8I2_9BILA